MLDRTTRVRSGAGRRAWSRRARDGRKIGRSGCAEEIEIGTE